MKPQTIMVVAGDPSGDANAAALVRTLAAALPGSRFLGAGGPKMREAGVGLSFDLTADAVIGLSDVFKILPRFYRHLRELTRLAAAEKPELIILVDFSGFNRRLAHALRAALPWRPGIVQYVSPQVWASRPGRADKLAKDIDLLLCLFPFEKEWYARRLPHLRVECVGHPMFDRDLIAEAVPPEKVPTVVLLPGSRRGELRRHLPVILGAADLIAAGRSIKFKLIAPSESMAEMARMAASGKAARIEMQIGQLEEALASATLAIACTGTVTMECARYAVPAVALYKTSLLNLVARRIVTVKYLAMPNLLAGDVLYPEFIQNEATAPNIAKAAIDLLEDSPRRAKIRERLREVVSTLGGPGATARAVGAILQLTGSADTPDLKGSP
ncbi:MAG: lipid-A-disaccharide synthase [Limisphaerales bacterium]